MVDSRVASGIVNWSKGGDLLTLAVKVADAPEGRVITFEDITRQILDQRQAAWSDVARRIAHEIKNPLTPIQLATERLKRRYRKQIDSDGELFDELGQAGRVDGRHALSGDGQGQGAGKGAECERFRDPSHPSILMFR